MDTNCTRLEVWLTDQPDAHRGELPAEWAQHVAACGSCAQCWHDERVLASAMVAWRANSPRPPATDALVSLLLHEVRVRQPMTASRTRRSVRSAWWPLILSSAALVVIGIGLSRSLPPESSPLALKSSEQLALTSTVGSLLNHFDESPHPVLTTGPYSMPAFPLLPSGETGDVAFDATEIIDPAAPSAVLRYGEPLGQGVGQAFRFLQIAVPIPMTDAG